MENQCFFSILFVLLAATAWQTCLSQTQLSTTDDDAGVTDASTQGPVTQAPGTQASGTQAPVTQAPVTPTRHTVTEGPSGNNTDTGKDTASVISTVALPLLICYVAMSQFAFVELVSPRCLVDLGVSAHIGCNFTEPSRSGPLPASLSGLNPMIKARSYYANFLAEPAGRS